MYFSGPGVEVNPLFPLLVAFLVSALTAPAGVSGAFLLPFQGSVLGFTSPAVSPTNLIYNVIAAPGGVYHFVREQRVVWPLAVVVIVGTLPGVFVGAVLRVTYLSDPGAFKVFVGLVLLYLGTRLLYEVVARLRSGGPWGDVRPGDAALEIVRVSLWWVRYKFGEKQHTFSIPAVFLLSLVVGVIGGIYSIGGGSIIAPFLVSVFGLPVYTVAGATMIGTFITSVSGAAFYEILVATPLGEQVSVAPDWPLGIVLGVGGLAGTYAGARLQRFIPDFWIRAILGVLVTLLALRYLIW